MKDVLIFQDWTADTRHPAFLSALSDSAYKKVFLNLIGPCKSTTLHQWSRITVFIRLVEQVVLKLVTHIILWFNIKFKKPANADKSLNEFNYVRAVATEVMVKRDLDKVKFGKDLNDYDAASQFIEDVVINVQRGAEIWKEKSLEAWVYTLTLYRVRL
ncbi:MAG: hypothetical protein M1830_005044 [Pleopsidium flavum]|nr:MAG: hypothetical protein M1830_005044 [Pleopsidium flavum]